MGRGICEYEQQGSSLFVSCRCPQLLLQVMFSRLHKQEVRLAAIGSTDGAQNLLLLWFMFCTVVVRGVDTMLDNDLMGDLTSSNSASSVRIRFSGAISSSASLDRFWHPLVDGCGLALVLSQLIMERLAACCCFNTAALATFCFREFCCDGLSVESCSCISIM